MVDYYTYLLRAVHAPGSEDAQSRRQIYDRARQIIETELRSRRTPVSNEELRAHRSALETAIERIEREMALLSGGVARPRAVQVEERRDQDGAAFEADNRPPQAPPRSRRAVWAVLAVVVLALGGGGYALWAKVARKPAVTASTSDTVLRGPARRVRAATAAVADLAPGVDGGSTDAEVPLVHRRQRVFYRTTLPVGSIVVDTNQNFLYLVQPNSVAVRYGIGLGAECTDLTGLRKILRMAEWPEWQPPPDMIRRKLAGPGPLPGAPGNPLGARLLDLDDGSSRIHGTNAPKTIGSAVAFGCVRLVNDDIVDLYGRTSIGTRVVMR